MRRIKPLEQRSGWSHHLNQPCWCIYTRIYTVSQNQCTVIRIQIRWEIVLHGYLDTPYFRKYGFGQPYLCYIVEKFILAASTHSASRSLVYSRTGFSRGGGL